MENGEIRTANTKARVHKCNEGGQKSKLVYKGANVYSRGLFAGLESSD